MGKGEETLKGPYLPGMGTKWIQDGASAPAQARDAELGRWDLCPCSALLVLGRWIGFYFFRADEPAEPRHPQSTGEQRWDGEVWGFSALFGI